VVLKSARSSSTLPAARYCFGKSYLVQEVTPDGHLVLDVHDEVDAMFGGYLNDIRVEPEFVDVVEASKS